jgi:hypothetical protein
MARITGSGGKPPVDPIAFRFRWARESQAKTFPLGQLVGRLTRLSFKQQELIRLAACLELTNEHRHPEIVAAIAQWPDRVTDQRGEFSANLTL